MRWIPPEKTILGISATRFRSAAGFSVLSVLFSVPDFFSVSDLLCSVFSSDCGLSLCVVETHEKKSKKLAAIIAAESIFFLEIERIDTSVFFRNRIGRIFYELSRALLLLIITLKMV